MTPEAVVLVMSAAAIAFLHTVLGPDHYLPFVAMARARNWSLARTLRVTLACGVGHLAGSVLLGLIGIAAGLQLVSLEWIEGLRGNLAAWLLVAFGLVYTAWGIRRVYRNRAHTHWHSHDGTLHRHEHRHQASHAHVHDRPEGGGSLAPWALFVVLVLGPCEPLIPLLMYPAARHQPVAVFAVTTVFGLVTLLTMLLAVTVAMLGLRSFRWRRLEPWGHAVAGGTILACGLGVALLGL